jgi:hypothetical protein
MTTLNATKRLLQLLTAEYPPMKKCNHSIYCNNDQLKIQLMFNEKYLPLILDDEELDNDIDSLFATIKTYVDDYLLLE